MLLLVEEGRARGREGRLGCVCAAGGQASAGSERHSSSACPVGPSPLSPLQARLDPERAHEPPTSLQSFVCGLAAGMIAKLGTHPLDVAKKRFQVGGASACPACAPAALLRCCPPAVPSSCGGAAPHRRRVRCAVLRCMSCINPACLVPPLPSLPPGGRTEAVGTLRTGARGLLEHAFCQHGPVAEYSWAEARAGCLFPRSHPPPCLFSSLPPCSVWRQRRCRACGRWCATLPAGRALQGCSRAPCPPSSRQRPRRRSPLQRTSSS